MNSKSFFVCLIVLGLFFQAVQGIMIEKTQRNSNDAGESIKGLPTHMPLTMAKDLHRNMFRYRSAGTPPPSTLTVAPAHISVPLHRSDHIPKLRHMQGLTNIIINGLNIVTNEQFIKNLDSQPPNFYKDLSLFLSQNNQILTSYLQGTRLSNENNQKLKNFLKNNQNLKNRFFLTLIFNTVSECARVFDNDDIKKIVEMYFDRMDFTSLREQDLRKYSAQKVLAAFKKYRFSQKDFGFESNAHLCLNKNKEVFKQLIFS